MRKHLRLIVIGLCLGTATAHAHDQWADGTPVPAWVKRACCGPEDAHHLRPGQVHVITTNGVRAWKVDGYDDPIPFGKELTSQDGDYWIFYRTLNNGDQSSVYCFFVPVSGT